MKVRDYRDPLMLMLDIINDRKKTLILYELQAKKKQAKEIACGLPQFQPTTIDEEIAILVEMGVLARKVHVKPTQYIEYALTNEGARTLRCIRDIMDVGIGIMMHYGMEEFLESSGYIERNVEVVNEQTIEEEVEVEEEFEDDDLGEYDDEEDMELA